MAAIERRRRRTDCRGNGILPGFFVDLRRGSGSCLWRAAGKIVRGGSGGSGFVSESNLKRLSLYKGMENNFRQTIVASHVIEVTPNDEFYPVILVAWIEKGRTLAELQL